MSGQTQETATIFEDVTLVVGRNPEGRLLFRYNRAEGSFFAFRSKRMTVDEKQLVAVMFRKWVPSLDGQSEEEAMKKLNDFLDYRVEEDVFCA